VNDAAPLELRPVLPLRCGDHCYALPLENVVEVAAMVAVAPVPGGAEALLGVANRGGSALPILDLRRWLGLAAPPLDARTLFVVVRGDVRDGAADEQAQMGLVVDEVLPVRSYPQREWERMSGAGHWVSHSIADGETLVQVVHAPSLLSAAASAQRRT